MYPGLDADDMVRRGLFSSLMPFRRKAARPSPAPARPPPVQTPVFHPPVPSSAPLPLSLPELIVHPIPAAEEFQQYIPERSQQDIFREIVHECAHIERSATTTPFSDGPMSPVPMMTPCPSPLMTSSPQMPPLHPQMGYGHGLYDSMMHPHYAPPPYPAEDSYLQPPQADYHLPRVMINPTAEQQMPNAVLLEEVVKMVVSAMKQSSLTGGEDSPEEILRRKRNQNNEAAARYRKRQRAARLRAEEELHLLSRRNDKLKNTVDHMEEEIQHLKELVLQNRQT